MWRNPPVRLVVGVVLLVLGIPSAMLSLGWELETGTVLLPAGRTVAVYLNLTGGQTMTAEWQSLGGTVLVRFFTRDNLSRWLYGHIAEPPLYETSGLTGDQFSLEVPATGEYAFAFWHGNAQSDTDQTILLAYRPSQQYLVALSLSALTIAAGSLLVVLDAKAEVRLRRIAKEAALMRERDAVGPPPPNMRQKCG